MVSDKRSIRVAGIGQVLVLVGVLALTVGFYTRAFSNPAEVTLQTTRAGLVMDPGNKVKMYGVEIGRVGQVRAAQQRHRLGGQELGRGHVRGRGREVARPVGRLGAYARPRGSRARRPASGPRERGRTSGSRAYAPTGGPPLVDATRWLALTDSMKGMRIGYFGASTGAAARQV